MHERPQVRDGEPDSTGHDTTLVRRIERSIRIGDHARARTMARLELRFPQSRRTAAALRLLLGHACTRLERADEALVHLGVARGHFHSVGDRAMALECLTETSTALCVREDDAALDVARQALHECRSLRHEVPLPTYRRVLAGAGHAFLLNHDWVPAVRLLQASRDLPAGGHDLPELAAIHRDLAAAWLGLGMRERAIQCGRSALRLCPVALDGLGAVQAEDVLGRALVRAGRLRPATALLDRALARSGHLGLQAARARVLLSTVELRLAEGDPEGAMGCATDAKELAEGLGARITAALAAQWRGSLFELAGDHLGADRSFAWALAALSPASSVSLKAECHTRYGQLLEARGDWAASLRQYKQAALLGMRETPASGTETAEQAVSSIY